MTAEIGGRHASQSSETAHAEALPWDDFEAVIRGANEGDDDALQRLRQLLEWNPDIWKSVADLGHLAKTALITEMAGDDLLMAESLNLKAAEMKESLISESPSRLEEMAADGVAISWMRLQQLEHRCAMLETNSRSWVEFWLKSRDRAQKAHEAAVRHLLSVQTAEKRLRPNGNGRAGRQGETARREASSV